MLKIFLASHGHLASGMKSSVEILLGTSDNLTVFDAYVDEFCDDSSVKTVIEDYLASLADNDTLVMCADLYGGSVNQVLALHVGRPNTYLVAGINLGFILELALKSEITKSELEQIIDDSKDALRLVELDKIELPSNDDFI